MPSVHALDRALVALRAQRAELGVTDAGIVPSERAARLDQLARLLQPLTDRVTPELRAEMSRRIAAGEAPSPFAVVD